MFMLSPLQLASCAARSPPRPLSKRAGGRLFCAGKRGRQASRMLRSSFQAVQSPAIPTDSPTESTPLDKFPKSKVQSRQNVLPVTETFKKQYADYSTGYASVPGLTYERSEWITDIEGQIPKELEGTLLRNGPAMYVRGEGAERFEKSYLDGDGMVTSVAIKDGKAYFRNKFVRTEDFDKEEKLGKYTEPSIFTAKDPRKPAFFWRLFNDILAGNLKRKQNGAYNVLNWGGNLVAVDYKKPYELDPDTLDTIGHAASPLSSVMHTSHYRTVDEPDGSGRRCVAFLNEVDWRSETTKAVFYEFDEAGNEVSRRAYDYPASYVHDLVVTDNYYILFDCPIKIDFPAVFTKYIFQKSCLSELICEDTDRRPLFRMFPRRGDSREVITIEADYWCYAYHHVNGFENSDGKIFFDTCTWDKFTLYFTDICSPNGQENFPRMKLSRFVIDVDSRKATHHCLSDLPCELPITSWDYTGKPYRHMYLSSSVGTNEAGVNGPMQALTKVTLPTIDALGDAREQEWIPGESKFAMEPFFVARKGAIDEDDGWVVALVHDANYAKSDFGGRGTEMVIIDAKKFEEGPVARIRLPVYIPFGVHGSWSTTYVAGCPKTAELEAIKARDSGRSHVAALIIDNAALSSVLPRVEVTKIAVAAVIVCAILTVFQF
mmetsp:Transcript_12583/g.49029  ORF Transcript_12583/g.49029 Transcript_12583/m.49029 type:complete len:659 (-) Transcript_12583:4489-6465(-)